MGQIEILKLLYLFLVEINGDKEIIIKSKYIEYENRF